ncbi:MAG: alanine racemase [Myxococcota bacterium]
MKLSEVPTPAAVLDESRLQRNLNFMATRTRQHNLRLRPHLKTAKSAPIARLATEGHFGGITVSTLAEAEYFFDRGITDLTYAVCITPDRISRARALVDKGATLQLITDSPLVAAALAASLPAPTTDRRALRVLVEIDSGEHRTGVSPESTDLLTIARTLNEGRGTELLGVLTHGGHAYAATSTDDIRRIAEQERASVVRAAHRLRAAGLPCEVISAGSTPTAVHAASFEGLTELRPGVYMFFDLAQVGLGSCRLEDIALSVLSTVVSHRPENGRLLIDAGGLALSKDASASMPDAGYGWLLDPITQQRIGDLRIVTADQEHGYVEGTDIPYDRLPIGARVRVVPNHACMTAAAYESYFVARDDRVVGRWPRLNGWQSPPPSSKADEPIE